MSVYTVHEPPLRDDDVLAAAERFIFVRDGFYWWAFLLTPFWMLCRRLWLVLAIYLVVIAGLDAALHGIGAPASLVTFVGVLISLLVGFEASTLWRFTLRRRRWKNVGIVSGDGLEDAERRFFDLWIRGAVAPSVTPSNLPQPSAQPDSRETDMSGVIGLFPEPGAQR